MLGFICHIFGNDIEIKPILNTIKTKFKGCMITKPKMEYCPACKEHLPQTSELLTQCINKHSWKRCMISLQIISSPDKRSCPTCKEQALGYFSAKDETPISRIMGGIKECLFCKSILLHSPLVNGS